LVCDILWLALFLRSYKKRGEGGLLLADAEAVGYAMFSSWEIWKDVAGEGGSRCRCNRKYGSRCNV